MAAVKRWHMIDTTRQQNLAEHTANVSLLSWVIVHTSKAQFFDPLMVLQYAMVHDLGEAFLGDVPTHSKLLIGKDLIDLAEQSVTPGIFRAVSPATDEKLLVKLCDLADGIRFVRLHGVDATAGHAQLGLEKQLVQRLSDGLSAWPLAVYNHVMESVIFYAYEETRNGLAGAAGEEHARRMGNDVAREQAR